MALTCAPETVPVTILNSPAVSRDRDGYGGIKVGFGTGPDIAGIVLWAIGFSWEALADFQKFWFKTYRKPQPPKGVICDIGVWRFSRRPNYFGEILHWWGIWLLAMSPAIHEGTRQGVPARISQRGHDALLGSLVSPLLTMVLLLFLSGVPTAEKPSQKKYYLMSHGPDGGKTLEPFGKTQREEDPWKRMKAFRDRTSLLLPMPTQFYRPLPQWIKSYILLDLPMFRFDESKDGPKAIEEERKKKNQGEEAA